MQALYTGQRTQLEGRLFFSGSGESKPSDVRYEQNDGLPRRIFYVPYIAGGREGGGWQCLGTSQKI